MSFWTTPAAAAAAASSWQLTSTQSCQFMRVRFFIFFYFPLFSQLLSLTGRFGGSCHHITPWRGALATFHTCRRYAQICRAPHMRTTPPSQPLSIHTQKRAHLTQYCRVLHETCSTGLHSVTTTNHPRFSAPPPPLLNEKRRGGIKWSGGVWSCGCHSLHPLLVAWEGLKKPDSTIYFIINGRVSGCEPLWRQTGWLSPDFFFSRGDYVILNWQLINYWTEMKAVTTSGAEIFH